MKNFKTLIAAGVVLLLGASMALAQIGANTPEIMGPFNGGSVIIPASAATNLTAVNTNSSASNCVVNVTDVKSFGLEVIWKPMNAASNLVDVRWSSSMVNSNAQYAVPSAGSASNRISGWFSTQGGDSTNASGFAVFRTNIAVNSEMNYWRLEYITNGSAIVLSNVTVRVWKKRLAPPFGP